MFYLKYPAESYSGTQAELAIIIAFNSASKNPINATKCFLRKKSTAFTRVVKSFLRHFLIMPRKLPFEANLSASNDIPFEAPLD